MGHPEVWGGPKDWGVVLGVLDDVFQENSVIPYLSHTHNQLLIGVC